MGRLIIMKSVIILTFLLSAVKASNDVDCMYDPKGKTKFKFENQGGLGNAMLVYTILLAVSDAFDYEVYINRKALEKLEYYFDFANENVRVAPEEICDSDPWKCFGNTFFLLQKPSLSRGHLFQLPTTVS